jgi:hypothetical protein
MIIIFCYIICNIAKESYWFSNSVKLCCCCCCCCCKHYVTYLHHRSICSIIEIIRNTLLIIIILYILYYIYYILLIHQFKDFNFQYFFLSFIYSNLSSIFYFIKFEKIYYLFTLPFSSFLVF